MWILLCRWVGSCEETCWSRCGMPKTYHSLNVYFERIFKCYSILNSQLRDDGLGSVALIFSTSTGLEGVTRVR